MSDRWTTHKWPGVAPRDIKIDTDPASVQLLGGGGPPRAWVHLVEPDLNTSVSVYLSAADCIRLGTHLLEAAMGRSE